MFPHVNFRIILWRIRISLNTFGFVGKQINRILTSKIWGYSHFQMGFAQNSHIKTFICKIILDLTWEHLHSACEEEFSVYQNCHMIWPIWHMKLFTSANLVRLYIIGKNISTGWMLVQLRSKFKTRCIQASVILDNWSIWYNHLKPISMFYLDSFSSNNLS